MPRLQPEMEPWQTPLDIAKRAVSASARCASRQPRNASSLRSCTCKTKREGQGYRTSCKTGCRNRHHPVAVPPQSLRKRVAQLMARQIRRAVDATMAAHDSSVSAVRDSLEAKALLEHQFLWTALLTRRMPDHHETDRDTAKKPNRAEGIQRLKQQRARVQKGEQGTWTDLLQEALQERETRTDDWKTPSIAPEITKRRTQEAALSQSQERMSQTRGAATTERRTERTADSRDCPSDLGCDCARTTGASRDPASFPGCEATRQTSTTHQHPQAHLGTMHERAPTGS